MSPNAFLSLGWGVQSFTLAAMSALGELPPLIAAVHADTTHERQATYIFAKEWTPWLTERDVNVITATAPDTNPCQGTQVMIPAFRRKGMLNRRCTAYWKIYPIRQIIHGILAPHIHAATNHLWLGISTDEAHRMKPSNVAYLTHIFPLIELHMSRDDCKRWLTSHDLPVPPRSACTCCPYQSHAQWADILTTPADRAHAISVDRQTRATLPLTYIHRDMRPVSEVTPHDNAQQLDLWQDECTGLCNV